jgi:hypothetical protein
MEMKPPRFNSTEDLIEAVREKRRQTGLVPPACLIRVCWDRKLSLTPREKHLILSRIAHLATQAREANKSRRAQANLVRELFPSMSH